MSSALRREVSLQGLGHTQQILGLAAGLGQGVSQLVGRELIPDQWHPARSRQLAAGLGVAADHLGRRSELARSGVGLDPVPGAHHPDQLPIGNTGEAVILARGGIGGDRQPGAARQHIQRHPGPERRRRARRLAGKHPRRAGLARSPAPGSSRLDRQQLVTGRLLDLGQLVGGQRREVLPVLLGGRLIGLGQAVQPRLPLLRRHRIRARPSGILVPLGRPLSRRRCH